MKQENRYLGLWIAICVIILFALLTLRCTSVPIQDKNVVVMPSPSKIPIPPPTQNENIGLPSLSWEKNHIERMAWSRLLYKEILTKFDILDQVTDMSKYCPKYKLLTKEQRINTWAEFMVALAYYESAWKPTESSQDVGEAGNYSTYSDGLFQVSAVDIQNYGLKDLPKYTHQDLLTVEPNIKLALALMTRQIQKQKLICVSSDVYWATLSCKWFARYEVNDDIANRVQKLGFCK